MLMGDSCMRFASSEPAGVPSRDGEGRTGRAHLADGHRGRRVPVGCVLRAECARRLRLGHSAETGRRAAGVMAVRA